MTSIMVASLGMEFDARDVAAAFAKFGAEWTGEALERSLVVGALLTQNDAKRRAPIKTGTLRRSIHIGGHAELAPGFNPSEGYDDIRGNSHTNVKAVIYVGTDLVYAARMEYGYVGRDSLGRNYHQGPRAYLRPAFDSNEARVEAAVAAELGRILARAGL